ncbi:MAG: TetR/AcrR family transcriptional regulator [Nocardia sp.]|uniref:TetR/AcrR family transcriptional regulator n=1 Tax=Nocardia sp. TaxID=1821 RepID=UPI00262A47DC|nr:TetR/AcrR family transcriptional regulator [Nocardia sp.]MCU1645846.1 TetR/AcrR family transcriptional regulator [Nocardia sp.]
MTGDATTAIRPQRRTQQQRRDETRAALLDATIDCLAESGYANLTLAQVSERAGLSVGAHLHHFRTRNTLVAAAIARLAERRQAELRDQFENSTDIEELLDAVWDLHTGALYHAALDLWAAARTDAELRELLLDVEHDIDTEIAEQVRKLAAEITDRPDLPQLMMFALATARGLAMRDCLHPDRDRDREWASARSYLKAALIVDPAGQR